MKTLRSLLLQIIISFSCFVFYYPAAASVNVWQWLNPVPTGNFVDGLAFLNGEFVVCSGSQVSASTDGVHWITHLVSIAGISNLNRIAFADGLYVAVGSTTNSGIIITSTNLQDWTAQSAGTPNALFTVAYGNGLFVAAGNGGTIVTSSNGSDWVLRDSGTTTAFKALAFGNGTFVATSGDIFGSPSISVSSDGVVWTPQNRTPASANSAHISTVNFLRGRFYLGGWDVSKFQGNPEETILSYSTDGTNWIDARAGGPGIRTFFQDASSVYAVDQSYPDGSMLGLQKSMDGISFERVPVVGFSGANAASGYTSGNGIILGAGAEIQTSMDGTNWITTSGPDPFLTDAACGNDVCVAVGGGFALPTGAGSLGTGSIIVSIKGGLFTNVTPPVNSPLCRVLFANGLFHCVGYNGTLLRSTNGTQWVQRNSSTGNHLRSICYGNGLYVAVGDGGTIITSPNGLVWTTRNSGTTSHLNGVTCAENLFVAVGGDATILTSTNGVDWNGQFADSLSTLFDVSFGLGQFVVVGANGIICTSLDGEDWVTQNSGTNELHSVAFADGTFIAVPNKSNILSCSTNGSDWTLQETGLSPVLWGVRSFNGTFLLAGENGAVLQSSAPGSLRLTGEWNEGSARFAARVTGGLGQTFRVQTSDSLETPNWTDLAGFTNAPSAVTFTDLDSVVQPFRFYRLGIP